MRTSDRPIVFMCYSPGQRPPHIADDRVSAAAPGCVRAPKECYPSEVHDPVVGFVHRCLSRAQTPRRFELSTRLSVSEADLDPTSAPEQFVRVCVCVCVFFFFFFGIFQKFWNFFVWINCARGNLVLSGGGYLWNSMFYSQNRSNWGFSFVFLWGFLKVSGHECTFSFALLCFIFVIVYSGGFAVDGTYSIYFLFFVILSFFLLNQYFFFFFS